MDPDAITALRDWLTEAALAGAGEAALVQGLCDRAVAAGLPLARVQVGLDTLHPVLEGYAFAWHPGADASRTPYARYSGDAENAENVWLRSPFYHLVVTGERQLRRRLRGANQPMDFPVLEDLANDGCTDYVAMVTRFGDGAAIGDMDAVYSSWSTDRDGGFSDADMQALDRLEPSLALAIRAAATAHIADTLVVTYLGRDAGRRVLRGQIERGVAEAIRAVLWFSDLQGFTKIADTTPPHELVPMLNDYADCVVSAVHDHGGQVMKFIGDGVMAIFEVSDPARACRCALNAADEAFRRIDTLNDRRRRDGRPVTGVYLGLHIGDVFYGNIGSADRLDFTVVGPAVNEVSRIEAMCRSLDQEIILSAAFADAARKDRDRLVSLGRYALRGVRRPQALYTLDREVAATGEPTG